jgi:hypothetical protein
MTHAFGLLLLTMMSAQRADVPQTIIDVPVVERVRTPCEARQDGPRRPTIVGRDGRFERNCYDPKVEVLRVFAEVAAMKGHGTVRIPFNRHH